MWNVCRLGCQAMPVNVETEINHEMHSAALRHRLSFSLHCCAELYWWMISSFCFVLFCFYSFMWSTMLFHRTQWKYTIHLTVSRREWGWPRARALRWRFPRWCILSSLFFPVENCLPRARHKRISIRRKKQLPNDWFFALSQTVSVRWSSMNKSFESIIWIHHNGHGIDFGRIY